MPDYPFLQSPAAEDWLPGMGEPHPDNVWVHCECGKAYHPALHDQCPACLVPKPGLDEGLARLLQSGELP